MPFGQRFVVLTAEGRAAIEHAAPGHVRPVRPLVFDDLTETEVEALESQPRPSTTSRRKAPYDMVPPHEQTAAGSPACTKTPDDRRVTLDVDTRTDPPAYGRVGDGGSMRQLALVLRAVNRQAVLVRVMLTAHRLGVAVLTASVPAGVAEDELADVELMMSGDAAVLRNFVARVSRGIDVASVRVRERPRLDVSVPQGSAGAPGLDPWVRPDPEVDEPRPVVEG